MKKFSTEKILWIAIAFYAFAFGVFAATRHYNFQTQTWDLGAFDQTFWNTVHGRIMENNLEEVHNHLGVHMSPWLFVLVPGYALFPSPYYLLIVQTFALALASWPLYLLATKILEDKLAALFIALSYLFYPAVHWISTYDFHEISFFIPLTFAGMYCMETKRWARATVFFALAASTKEDAALVIAGIGLYYFFRFLKTPRAWRISALIFFGALIYFALSVKFIMPAFGGGLLRLDRYGNVGRTGEEIVYHILTQPLFVLKTISSPAKLIYFLWLFVPVGFLPFLGGGSWITIIPGLLENMLTSFEFQFAGLYQYDAVLVPGIFLATIFGFKKVLGRFSLYKKRVFTLFTVCFMGAYFFRSPLKPLEFPTWLFRGDERQTVYRKFLAITPEEASVAAPTNLVPHLTHREHVYMLGREPFPTDIVFIDMKDDFGFSSADAFTLYIERLLASGLYTSRVVNDHYVLLVRKGFGSIDTKNP